MPDSLLMTRCSFQDYTWFFFITEQQIVMKLCKYLLGSDVQCILKLKRDRYMTL